MAIMRNLLLILLALFFSTSTCQKKTETAQEQKMLVVQDTLNKYQLDSALTADELSYDIENDWIDLQVLNEEKSDVLHKYLYISELNDSTGTVYTLWSYMDTLYILNKRTVE